MESKLISLPTQAGRVTLDNGTGPGVPALPEADKSDMDLRTGEHGELPVDLLRLSINAELGVG